MPDHFGDPDRPLFKERTVGEQALLDAAVTCLEQSGWDGAQVPDILEIAHASKSSLYHYFGSREGLLAAAALPASQSLTPVARLLEETPCTDINHKQEVQHAVDL